MSREQSKSCQQYYAGMNNPPAAAVRWSNKGNYFAWKSTLPENAAYGPLNIFYVCMGNPDKPALVLIHGYPTSSYDFSQLVDQLSNDFYLCALDTPGYGFSDKPKNRYHYSIVDDARLVDDFVREVIGLKHFTLLTHDKGDSVGLALLHLYQSYPVKPYTINHHIITNGNMYLPLAQLSLAQKLFLNPITGPILSALLGGSQVAKGIATRTYTPPLPASEVASLASIFDYQNGVSVEHDLIQYLHERKVNEVIWLEALGSSDIPTTLIWGERDAIAPPAVPDYVWTKYLKDRKTPASYWRLPCANHYLQVDQPEVLATLIRSALEPATPLSQRANTGCQPVKIH